MCKDNTLSNKLISLRKKQKQQKNELLKSIIIEYLTQSYLKYQTKVDIKTYNFYIEVKSVVYLECEKSIRTKLHDFINDIYNKYPEFISSPRITYGYEKDTIYFSIQIDAAEFANVLNLL